MLDAECSAITVSVKVKREGGALEQREQSHVLKGEGEGNFNMTSGADRKKLYSQSRRIK